MLKSASRESFGNRTLLSHLFRSVRYCGLLFFASPAMAAPVAGLDSVTAASDDQKSMELVRVWQSRVETTIATAPQGSSRRERIARMVATDQAQRQYLWLFEQPQIPPSVRDAAEDKAWEEISASDASHVYQLKALIPSDGWFSLHRDGATVAHGAWLILQHSRDLQLMETVLQRLERLLRLRDADPHDFALLSDRVSVARRQPQRFGTQAVCSTKGTGLMELYSTAGDVDRARSAIGWGVSLAETLADLKVGRPCRQ